MFLVGANRETDSLFNMLTKEECAVEVKKSSYTEEEVNAAYQKGRSVGRVEGMIAYQKRIVEKLQKDNIALNDILLNISPIKDN